MNEVDFELLKIIMSASNVKINDYDNLNSEDLERLYKILEKQGITSIISVGDIVNSDDTPVHGKTR